MKVIIFGATGMIGQGVLHQCLLAPDVESVLAVTRSPLGRQDPRLRELVHRDFTDFSAIEGQLAGYDACFFCLGVSSVGMNEADYRRVTHDFTLAAARALLRASPGLTFIYVSGASTDAASRTMWARVKGQTENALLALPFKRVYMFRPGFIQPLHGITSKTRLYRAIYAIGRPIYPLLRALAPGVATDTDQMGRAMLAGARQGLPKPILETTDIRSAGSQT
jgi:uncharacterized protein YbjT (DUF2867 family)